MDFDGVDPAAYKKNWRGGGIAQKLGSSPGPQKARSRIIPSLGKFQATTVDCPERQGGRGRKGPREVNRRVLVSCALRKGMRARLSHTTRLSGREGRPSQETGEAIRGTRKALIPVLAYLSLTTFTRAAALGTKKGERKGGA